MTTTHIEHHYSIVHIKHSTEDLPRHEERTSDQQARLMGVFADLSKKGLRPAHRFWGVLCVTHLHARNNYFRTMVSAHLYYLAIAVVTDRVVVPGSQLRCM